MIYIFSQLFLMIFVYWGKTSNKHDQKRTWRSCICEKNNQIKTKEDLFIFLEIVGVQSRIIVFILITMKIYVNK